METIAAPLPGAAVAAPKKRWFRADNIRYILLFNVIAEHMLTQTGICAGVAPVNITAHWIVTVIVCWSRMITMPGFCFISGYFSKKGYKCYQSAVFDFLVPYLIFNSLFVLFHKVAFTNDLWLLNPQTDLLIRLMPIEFFISYAAIIGCCWLLGMLAMLIFATIRIRKLKATEGE